MNTRVARLVGLAAATAVAVPLVAAAPASADQASAKSAGRWATAQLDDGLLPSPFAGFPDQGLSIDLALSLQASGQRAGVVTTIRDAVAREIDGYAAPYTFPDGDDTVGATPSNATAKSLVLAVETGGDPSDFGGLDLRTQLEDVVTDGRLSDEPTRNGQPDPEAVDYANAIGQSFAARGLAAVGSEEARAARAYLLSQQCDDGSFRLDLADPADVAAACASSDPDTDVTALALINIAPLGGKKAARALAAGTAWLRGAQATNGSFSGTGPTDTPNANSTGLASQALLAGDRLKPARRAATWVAGLQLVNSAKCSAFDGDDVGAIAYDRAALRAAVTDGITAATADQFRRTTAQALPALSLAPKATATGSCR